MDWWRSVENALNLSDDEIRRSGLCDNIIEVASERSLAKLWLRGVRDHMGSSSRWTGLEQPRRLETIEDGHRDIHQDDNRLRVVRADDAFETVRRSRHPKARCLKYESREFATILRVVDNQDSSIGCASVVVEEFAEQGDSNRLHDLTLMSRVSAYVAKRRQQTAPVMEIGSSVFRRRCCGTVRGGTRSRLIGGFNPADEFREPTLMVAHPVDDANYSLDERRKALTIEHVGHYRIDLLIGLSSILPFALKRLKAAETRASQLYKPSSMLTRATRRPDRRRPNKTCSRCGSRYFLHSRPPFRDQAPRRAIGKFYDIADDVPAKIDAVDSFGKFLRQPYEHGWTYGPEDESSWTPPWPRMLTDDTRQCQAPLEVSVTGSVSTPTAPSVDRTNPPPQPWSKD